MSFEENVPNEQLRRARHLKGWTQSELAETLDTDFETVSRWERGTTVPSSYFREKLCSVLDKTPKSLGLSPLTFTNPWHPLHLAACSLLLRTRMLRANSLHASRHICKHVA
jgi:transcriptional regulator with XRE-family HTH domain